MTLRLGEMTERFVILEPVTAADTQGGEAVTWEPGATVWGQLRWEPSREALQLGALQGLIPLTLLLYAEIGISLATWRRRRLRRLEDGLTYEIVGARETGPARLQVELDAVEVP